jgi:hypothetical protein
MNKGGSDDRLRGLALATIATVIVMLLGGRLVVYLLKLWR